jgi:hypothetical protein
MLIKEQKSEFCTFRPTENNMEIMRVCTYIVDNKINVFIDINLIYY